MAYQIKEVFYTLQGEGAQAGRPAVFCRFAGCNLWSGREVDRLDAACRFCDTDFVGTNGTSGGRYDSAQLLVERIVSFWPQTQASQHRRYVVLTGGEPLLQVDPALIEALHAAHFEIAVETNGTLAAPPGLDWICVSPKASSLLPHATEPWRQRQGNELKLIWPQEGLELAVFDDAQFTHRFLQPMDVSDSTQRQLNVQTCIAQCLADPRWRLSLQTHKITGIR